MSLIKWKELAKSKSDLGNKINYVRDTITEKTWVKKHTNIIQKSIQQQQTLFYPTSY